MKHQISIKVGPRSFRVGSAWREPVAVLEQLYRDYPKPDDNIVHHSVRLEPSSFLRRWFRRSVDIGGDYMLPEAAPLPFAMGPLAAEMAMNLQVALSERRYLLLHAATVERGGKALILTGESGSGKSTMSAVLMARGWRLLGDEFALIDVATGLAHPFPRPISLKNHAVEVIRDIVGEDRLGPWMRDTPKGDIRHLIPNVASINAMGESAKPALLLFPAFGHAAATRPVGAGEVFVRLTQASTNYTALGETGFDALTRFVADLPARAIDYPDTETGVSLVEAAWAECA